MKTNTTVKKMVLISMMAAISYVSTLVFHLLHLSFIPVPSLSFLTYDPKDIIICITGFILGPSAALIIAVIVPLLEMVTFSSQGWIGLIMNVISTCALVIPAAFIYKSKRSFKGALLSLAVGFVSVLIMMTLWNIIVTPLYGGISRKELIRSLLGWIVLFNAIKVLLNISFILILYKPLTSAIRFTGLLEKNGNSRNLKTSLVMCGVGGILLVVLVIVIVLLNVLK